MIIRVEIDNVCAMVDLDGEPWTPELVDTFLRMCREEVVATAISLGVAVQEASVEDEVSGD